MSFNQFAYLAFIVLAPISALTLITAIFFIWPHRRMAGVKWLIASAILIAGALIGNTLELLAQSKEFTKVFSIITYFFAIPFPATFFIFSLEYARPSFHKKLSLYYPLLYIIPALTIFFRLWLSSGLIWRDYAYHTYYGLLALDVLSYGPWFWVHTIYSYITTLSGWGLLTWAYFTRRNTQRRTSRLVLGGILLAFFANLLYVLRLLPTTKDYTAVFLTLSLMLIIVGILRERLFQLRPLAALAVIDNLNDGIFLLDDYKNIIDINAAAQKILGYPPQIILKQSIEAYISPCQPSIPNQWTEIAITRADGEKIDCEVQCLPVFTRNNEQAGYVIALRDISVRKRYEYLLLEKIDQTNRLYDASNALLQSIALDDVLHALLIQARKLIPDTQRAIWYPLSENMPQIMLALPSGQTIPPLKLNEGAESREKLPVRILEKPEHSIYLQPIQNPRGIMGILALECPPGREFTADEQKLLESFSLTAASALQNAMLHAAIEESAITDPLTYAYNRRGLYQFMQEHMGTQSDIGYTAIMLDVDNLKQINDQYGHEAGDLALKFISEATRQHIRAGDIFSRYGGDEFLIILPEMSAATAEQIAERLRQHIHAEPLTHEENSFHVSVSLGIAQGKSGEAVDAVIKRADQALYEAKKHGRNRTETA